LTLLNQVSSFQTLISAVISACIVIIGIFITEFFNKKTSNRNYIIDHGYEIHERLRDNLKNFLRTEPYIYIPISDKVSKENITDLNISYESFEKNFKKEDVFSNFHEITSYQLMFDDFQKLLIKDIIKVSKLSIPKVQKIATKIEALYDETKQEEELLSDGFQDDFIDVFEQGIQLNDVQKSYIKFIEESHKKIFWIRVNKLLLKLEKEIERVVKLQL